MRERSKKKCQVCYDPATRTPEKEKQKHSQRRQRTQLQESEIIMWDYEDEETVEGRKIRYIPLWKWLLEK